MLAQTLNGENTSKEGCVMLALSTFRRSEKAVDVAIEKCRENKNLMLVYVVDFNVARYLVGVEEKFFISLKYTCEEDLLEKAEKEGLQVNTLVKVGRFAVVCLEVVKQTHPFLIVTTRSIRPDWVKKFFGAPVDELTAKAGCPVLVI